MRVITDRLTGTVIPVPENHYLKCELDSLHASEAWDEGLGWRVISSVVL